MFNANDEYFDELVSEFQTNLSTTKEIKDGNQFLTNTDDSSVCVDYFQVIHAMNNRIIELEKRLDANIVISDTEHAMLLLRHKGS